MRWLPLGSSAVLLELGDLAQAMALHRQLLVEPVAGVVELVPAARTLLLKLALGQRADAALQQALQARWQRARAHAALPAAGRVVEIAVRYDGADLPDVAELLGISVREVIARHTGQPWQAAFAGFAPGFVYLAGGHPCFQLPRRPSPRTRVPAGSVALAGHFSAIYPHASPGGWQLIGTTDARLWDLQRPGPALVQPGFEVQFRDAAGGGRMVSLPTAQRQDGGVAAPAGELPAAPPGAPGPAAADQTLIEVLHPGLQTLVQDGGRRGQAGLGISASGALDRGALHAANRLVGNPVDTPALENLLGGLRLRSHGHTTLAVAGADLTLHVETLDGTRRTLRSPATIALNDGDVLTLAAPEAGVRAYVALRGGWQVAPVLGSASSDTLARIGPAPLQAGMRLAVGGVAPGRLRAVELPEAGAGPALPRPGDRVTLDVLLGPRTDWFTPEAVELLQRQEWQVTPQSDRVGMRLQGAEPLARARTEELPSEGTVAGALQVPANGQPLLFLADHPLTIGYPVIATLASHHLDRAAQIPVGCRLRFRVVAPFAQEVFP
ncbi:5-oxoprolinase/urea amidolyase family protein [Melaminivora sp.]|uniref:5-oxoprolinase subunit B/C family protein n=1 Tax=Melaminivora sp. TaxID=1933032 RepID=UPI0028AD3028|nr:5-oxoprolinase/urea amidolyase family protein [Melaminivora sp.]